MICTRQSGVSNHIFDEWRRVIIRKGVNEAEAEKRIEKANLAFPDALVKNYEGLIDHLELPDENDRHVLAAASARAAFLFLTGIPYGLFMIKIGFFS